MGPSRGRAARPRASAWNCCRGLREEEAGAAQGGGVPPGVIRTARRCSGTPRLGLGSERHTRAVGPLPRPPIVIPGLAPVLAVIPHRAPDQSRVRATPAQLAVISQVVRSQQHIGCTKTRSPRSSIARSTPNSLRLRGRAPNR